VLAETFLTASDEENFSFPRQFLSFSSPAVRERGRTGRSAGGVTVLIRASLFNLEATKFEVINQGLVSLFLVTKLGFSFTLLTGYIVQVTIRVNFLFLISLKTFRHAVSIFLRSRRGFFL
jgi:hypothetical protein